MILDRDPQLNAWLDRVDAELNYEKACHDWELGLHYTPFVAGGVSFVLEERFPEDGGPGFYDIYTTVTDLVEAEDILAAADRACGFVGGDHG